MKKKILFVGEASFLNTGFSNIYRSLLPRLVATGKYEIAEHGSYSDANHPDINNFIAGRWKFYHAAPSTQEELIEFNKYLQCPRPRSRHQNTAQFGEWNFDQVCADFQPDCLISLRDFWMDEFIEFSSFRNWFRHIWMPTVDAPYQAEDWIDAYQKVDMCLAYSDFGVHTLKMQGPKIRLFPKPMRPGVDLDVFYPMNKDEVRAKFNLSKDILIIGMVQRNQSRKNILDVMDAFALMKNQNRNNLTIQRAVLLLHTSWPDNAHSFDYPRHLKRLQSDRWMKNYCPGIMNDVLQSLICHNCGQASVLHAAHLYNKPVQVANINGRRIQGIFLPCSYCGQQTTTCPSTGMGHSREQLSEVYNLMDVMVQCSIAEGCFAKGTLVTTANGLKAIERITNRDVVLTHKGEWQPVHKTHINTNPGCLELGIYGDNTHIIGTINHEVFTQDGLKRIDQLNERDYLIRPIDQTVNIPDKLIFGLEDNDNIFKNGKMHHKTRRYFNGYPTNTTVSSVDLGKHAYFVGGFLAEGFVSRQEVGFALSINGDEKLKQSFYDFALDVGCQVRERQKCDTNGIELTISSPSIVKLFSKLFGTNARNKRIPIEFLQAPLNIQADMIGGYFDGDGCLEFHNDEIRPSRRQITTVSRSLAYQYRDVLLRFHILSNVYHNKKRNDYRVITFSDYSLAFDKQINSVKVHNSGYRGSYYSKNRSKCFIKDNYLYSKIKHIKSSNYNDKVFNLTVGTPNQYTSSYNLGSIAVKNCGMPVQESKSCGVPTIVTDHSAIAEKGRFPSEYVHFKELGTKESNYTVHKGGIIHEVAAYRHEPETGCLRAVPNIQDLANKMKLLLTDNELRRRMSIEARQCAEQNYDWDKIARDWELLLDSIKIKDRAKTWDSPIQPVVQIAKQEIPAGLTDEQFVAWLYIDVLRYPAVDPNGAQMWIHNLRNGVTREQLLDKFIELGTQQADVNKRREEIRARAAGVRQSVIQETQQWI